MNRGIKYMPYRADRIDITIPYISNKYGNKSLNIHIHLILKICVTDFNSRNLQVNINQEAKSLNTSNH